MKFIKHRYQITHKKRPVFFQEKEVKTIRPRALIYITLEDFTINLRRNKGRLRTTIIFWRKIREQLLIQLRTIRQRFQKLPSENHSHLMSNLSYSFQPSLFNLKLQDRISLCLELTHTWNKLVLASYSLIQLDLDLWYKRDSLILRRDERSEKEFDLSTNFRCWMTPDPLLYPIIISLL